MRFEVNMTIQKGYLPVAKIMIYDVTTAEDVAHIIETLKDVQKFLVRYGAK